MRWSGKRRFRRLPTASDVIKDADRDYLKKETAWLIRKLATMSTRLARLDEILGERVEGAPIFTERERKKLYSIIQSLRPHQKVGRPTREK